jgi:demethylmenaquinone methyltransferase/2-methoxy-6-polyprenyl-1,4-benzoquinol methylase
MGDLSYEGKIRYFDGQVKAPWSFQEYGEDERKKLDRLFQYTGPLAGFHILEPGCGTGRLTEILSDQAGELGRVTALDISPKMVEAARKRVAGRQNVEVHLSSLESFPLKPDSFDHILCHQVFPHFENKAEVLKLLSGGLKRSGKLAVFHFINYDQINNRHRKAGTAVEGDMMPPADVMEGLFEKAGFKIEFVLDDDLGYFLGAVRR